MRGNRVNQTFSKWSNSERKHVTVPAGIREDVTVCWYQIKKCSLGITQIFRPPITALNENETKFALIL